MHLPVVDRNACVRGLTCGAIPSFSATQDCPVDASAKHCRQQA